MKKQLQEKLHIIGNGFDLHHKIKSKYVDFKHFLETSDSEFYDEFTNYCIFDNDEDWFWLEFERNLANIELDKEQIREEKSCFLKDYCADDWSDSYHHDYQYEIEEKINKLYGGLKRNFIEWVQQLNRNTRDIQFSTEIPMLKLNKDALFLSFNYTDTLENLYQVPSYNIKHIHGSASNIKSDIIFGHGADFVRKEYGDSDTDPRELDAEDILDTRFRTLTRKPTKKIISANQVWFKNLQNIKEIIIIGHSLNDIDADYYVAIHDTVLKSAHWTITTYAGEKSHEIEEKTESLHKIGVSVQDVEVIPICELFERI
ncbi:hypothetical protein FACS1894170_12640 [Planctomycetales bacterium]|nr:hypothetical protein FACS1894170_12640 [Planctomycetales bacterium]